MAQFASDKKAAPAASKKTVRKTVNRAGGAAFTQTPELELAQLLLTFKGNEQYYRSKADSISRIGTLVAAVDPEYAAKAALYARDAMGMRSTPHIVAAEVAFRSSGTPFAAQVPVFLDKVSVRADDVTEILGYYLVTHGKKKLTNAMRKGLGRALARFDDYQLAKYRGSGNALSMVDAVNLLHPPHTDSIKKLVEGTLPPADTWETRRSAAGKVSGADKQEALSESWKALIESKKLPYFAAIRNIVTIGKEVPDLVDDVCSMIVSPKAVEKSRLWTYHFYLAIKAVRGARSTQLPARVAAKLEEALSKALDLSVKNIPDFEGNTLVATDFSSSMDSPVSEGRKDSKSNGPSLSCREAGVLMGVSLAKKSHADFMIFGTTAAFAPVSQMDSIAGQAEALSKLNKGHSGSGKYDVGHGTNFHTIFQLAKESYDRVFIFSDMQHWMEGALTPSVTDYKKRTGADPTIFMWNLAGYETSVLPQNRIVSMAGFNANVFDAIKSHDETPLSLVKKINEIVL